MQMLTCKGGTYYDDVRTSSLNQAGYSRNRRILVRSYTQNVKFEMDLCTCEITNYCSYIVGLSQQKHDFQLQMKHISVRRKGREARCAV